MNKPTVVITHTAQSQKWHTVKDVDSWHRLRWPGFTSRSGWHVGYHYVIEWDGTVTQTRQDDEEGAHVIGMNKSSIGVCFMGNGDLHEPSLPQLTSWYKLYDQLRKKYPNIPTYPHRKYANKTCHGALLSDHYFALNYQVMSLKERVAQLRALLANMVTGRRAK